MFSKILALSAVFAVSQAGLLAEPQYSSAAAVSSQSIIRHDEQAPSHYQAAPVHYAAPVAKIAYQAAPAHYSSGHAVSSQSIVHHDTHHAKIAVAAPVYHANPAQVYHAAAPAQVYHAAAPAQVYHAAAPAQVYHAAPAQVYHATPIAQHEEYSHPKYEFNYSVKDTHTGDIKSQEESRDGDVVKGSYSLHEADGSVRTVEYSADKHSGFNAVVHNTAAKVAHAPVLIKAHAPVYAAAPSYEYHH